MSWEVGFVGGAFRSDKQNMAKKYKIRSNSCLLMKNNERSTMKYGSAGRRMIHQEESLFEPFSAHFALPRASFRIRINAR